MIASFGFHFEDEMFEFDDALDVDDSFFNIAFGDEQDNIGSDHLVETRKIEKNSKDLDCKNFLYAATKQGSQIIKQNTNGTVDTFLQNNYSNTVTKRKIDTLPTPRSKRERKFPGPAGLLPDRKSSEGTPLKLNALLESDQSPNSVELCSQGRCSGSVLEEEPWQSFLSDLGEDKTILDLVNVASVKRKAAAKCFVGRKVPFLAAVLHHIDVSSPDPCIILRDVTGEIHGTLHREVWDQFAGELAVGSVLAIRNVGLLSTGISSRRHYLNITANNIVTIYSATSDKMKKTMLHHFTTQDYVQTIEHWRTLIPSSNGVGSPLSFGSPHLNTSVSSPLPGNVSCDMLNSHNNADVNQRLINQNNSGLFLRLKNNQGFKNINSSQGSQPLGFSKSPVLMKQANKNLFPTSGSNLHQTNNPKINQPQLLNKVQNETVRMFPSCSKTSHSTVTQPSNKFTFNPVIFEAKSKSNDIFSQMKQDINYNNNKREAISLSNNVTSNRLDHRSAVSPRVMLSQSSQLTAEEQSLVESVFDGIDADSLFSEDF